jgi:DNA-directed RNA polymerase subunit K/omega
MDTSKIWELSLKVGGLFKLTVLIQKRIRELVNGAPKLVETSSEDVIEIALMEIEQEKISLEPLTEEEIESEKSAEAGETFSEAKPAASKSPFGTLP